MLGLSAFVVGGYWYVRAAIKTGGNPIPAIGFGPLHLPRPDQMPLDPRPRFAVAHYLTDPTIYRRWFFPQLDNAFGPLWPLILIVAVAAAVFIAVRSRNRILRVIAAAALLTAVVYVFTPLTAAGQEGSPTGFFTNTRYLVPGLVLALALLPIARPLRAPDSRAWQTLLFLAAVYAITVLTTPRWYPDYIVGTVFLTLALVWAPAALGLLRGRAAGQPRPRRRGGGAACCCSRWCWAAPRRSSTPTSTTRRTTLFLQDGGPQEAYAFAHNLHDKRIGIAGSGEIFFGQYGFYGANLDNYVQYIGVPGPDGTYRLATTCRQFRRRINAGDYDYLIISQFTQDSPEARLLVPDLRLGEDRPGAEAGRRRARHHPPARLRLQGQRQARPAGCPTSARRPTLRRARACSRTRSAERSRLLPPEHVADALEQLRPSADQRGDLACRWRRRAGGRRCRG